MIRWNCTQDKRILGASSRFLFLLLLYICRYTVGGQNMVRNSRACRATSCFYWEHIRRYKSTEPIPLGAHRSAQVLQKWNNGASYIVVGKGESALVHR